jgi:hypothetical protein
MERSFRGRSILVSICEAGPQASIIHTLSIPTDKIFEMRD